MQLINPQGFSLNVLNSLKTIKKIEKVQTFYKPFGIGHQKTRFISG
jgi:hypothetical protein